MKTLELVRMTKEVVKGRRIFFSLAIVIAILSVLTPGYSAPLIRYEGSATIGGFIDVARNYYGRAIIMMNVMTESKGGEECILAGKCDIGGVAERIPSAITERGINSTQIGRDGVAVIVNSGNPVNELSIEQLKGVFSGEINNWSKLGGPDKPIQVLITRPNSAIRSVFKEVVLGNASYKAETVDPYSQIALRISTNRWAIGQISLFFIDKIAGVKAIKVEGQVPTFDNPDYPISRPLYLLTSATPSAQVRDFIEWVLSPEGQRLLKKFFIGVN